MTAGPDPRFPNRPDHPHFRLLADLAKELDGDTGARIPGPPAFYEDEQIDPASADYAASQRAMRVVALSQFVSRNPQYTHEVAWLDGFALGYLFALNRTDLP